MCIIAEVFVKYALFLVNLLFTLGGLALIGLGAAVLIQSDILGNEAIVENAVRAIPIAVIVLGAVIFLIAFLGCCGAIKESRCFLMTYSIIMLLLAGGKIYLAVVLFQVLDTIKEVVENWLGSAFNNNNLRDAYHALEISFQCCGTTGPESYTGILSALPPSCCAVPQADNTCARIDAFVGCNSIVGDYFETFGTSMAGILVVIIALEVVAFFFGCFMCYVIGNRRRKTV